jgi:bifunctional polynucleotide phosphatase/kinase
MDDTLIKVKSGAKFPKDSTDWLFWDESVPKKLKEYS